MAIEQAKTIQETTQNKYLSCNFQQKHTIIRKNLNLLKNSFIYVQQICTYLCICDSIYRLKCRSTQQPPQTLGTFRFNTQQFFSYYPEPPIKWKQFSINTFFSINLFKFEYGLRKWIHQAPRRRRRRNGGRRDSARCMTSVQVSRNHFL